ncbi:MAG: hypothetical protein K0R24_1117 [Gammaproteobacteria bacterium]|jgi:hypothetical protein|nr:hypothetical protein [Gammaproteobacteria bacterium]
MKSNTVNVIQTFSPHPPVKIEMLLQQLQSIIRERERTTFLDFFYGILDSLKQDFLNPFMHVSSIEASMYRTVFSIFLDKPEFFLRSISRLEPNSVLEIDPIKNDFLKLIHLVDKLNKKKIDPAGILRFEQDIFRFLIKNAEAADTRGLHNHFLSKMLGCDLFSLLRESELERQEKNEVLEKTLCDFISLMNNLPVSTPDFSFEDLRGLGFERVCKLLNGDPKNNSILKSRFVWQMWEMERPEFDSHIQWLPKEVFEDTLKLSETQIQRTTNVTDAPLIPTYKFF